MGGVKDGGPVSGWAEGGVICWEDYVDTSLEGECVT